MLKVAANPDTLREDIECSLRRPSRLVVELHMIVNPVANRNRTLPSLRGVPNRSLAICAI